MMDTEKITTPTEADITPTTPKRYNKNSLKSDLFDPAMPHIKDKKRFRSFYEELGKTRVQTRQQYIPYRTDWIQPKGKIIELGCHAGFNLIHWAHQGFICYGVDVSSTLLQEAEWRIQLESSEVQKRIHLI